MGNIISGLVGILLAVLPIILVVRWRHWGLLASIPIGWAFMYTWNVLNPVTDRTEALFPDVWITWGWMYTFLWLLPLYLITLAYLYFHQRKQKAIP